MVSAGAGCAIGLGGTVSLGTGADVVDGVAVGAEDVAVVTTWDFVSEMEGFSDALVFGTGIVGLLWVVVTVVAVVVAGFAGTLSEYQQNWWIKSTNQPLKQFVKK